MKKNAKSQIKKKLVINLFFLMNLLFFPFGAQAQIRESEYQSAWCHGAGLTEVVLIDRTRVDCLTKNHAIEFDFARSKWAESIGQSLHYSRMTGKRAGIVLIVRSDVELKYLDRVRFIIDHFNLPIDICAHYEKCPEMRIYLKSMTK